MDNIVMVTETLVKYRIKLIRVIASVQSFLSLRVFLVVLSTNYLAVRRAFPFFTSYMFFSLLRADFGKQKFKDWLSLDRYQPDRDLPLLFSFLSDSQFLKRI